MYIYLFNIFTYDFILLVLVPMAFVFVSIGRYIVESFTTTDCIIITNKIWINQYNLPVFICDNISN